MAASVTVTMARPSSLEVLRSDEVAAWGEYLAATRAQEFYRYVEVEPWAWKRLGARLVAIQARRLRLESPVRRTHTDEGASPAAGPEDDGA